MYTGAFFTFFLASNSNCNSVCVTGKSGSQGIFFAVGFFLRDVISYSHLFIKFLRNFLWFAEVGWISFAWHTCMPFCFLCQSSACQLLKRDLCSELYCRTMLWTDSQLIVSMLLKSYLLTLYWNIEHIRGFTRMHYTNLLTYLALIRDELDVLCASGLVAGGRWYVHMYGDQSSRLHRSSRNTSCAQ